ncbi:MAG: type II toxin-antitoxin system Phd/YefM family antitoxin [Christensenellales bacterium]|jgi:prevent-host-death family protein
MKMATATEVQNNFGRFLQAAIDGKEVIITKNGKEVARLISRNETVSFLTDSLTGVLKNDYDDKAAAKERYEAHARID